MNRISKNHSLPPSQNVKVIKPVVLRSVPKDDTSIEPKQEKLM